MDMIIKYVVNLRSFVFFGNIIKLTSLYSIIVINFTTIYNISNKELGSIVYEKKSIITNTF